LRIKIIFLLLPPLIFGSFTCSCANKNALPGQAHNINILTVTRYSDLNGDGTVDTITLTALGEDCHAYTLQVNKVKIAAMGSSIEPMFNIVDIDLSDRYKEIAISEYGPSGDIATIFYYYDGAQLQQMGKIGGFYGLSPLYGHLDWCKVEIDGSGTVSGRSRGLILHTWFYREQFKLSSRRVLQPVPQDLYEMNAAVEVLTEIPLRKSRTDPAIALTLQKGEKVTIVASDNQEWCLVRNAAGETGWFAVINNIIIKELGLPAGEVFSGLNFAD
jgi:hypothetical protein